MAYQFTFTDRFKKHFKKLNGTEKKQLMNKLELLAETRCIRLSEPRGFREQRNFLNAASTWISASSGSTKEML